MQSALSRRTSVREWTDGDRKTSVMARAKSYHAHECAQRLFLSISAGRQRLLSNCLAHCVCSVFPDSISNEAACGGDVLTQFIRQTRPPASQRRKMGSTYSTYSRLCS